MNGHNIDVPPKMNTYLSSIYYYDAQDQDVTCQCAVKCESKEQFDGIVKEHLAKQGATFIWSTDIYEAIDWIRTFGQMKTQVDLIQEILKGKTIALSEFVINTPKPVITNTENPNYLRVEKIENFKLLDMQMGVHPRLIVPNELHAILFGDVPASDNELKQYGKNIPSMSTYAILDAAKMPYLLTGEIEHSRLAYQSLFQGNAQDDYAEHAPYIVKLEPDSEFVRKLFTKLTPPIGLWDKYLGTFFRSRESLSELRQHFRKFTKVQNEQGKWFYFRFWEPGVISYYLEHSYYPNDKIGYIYKPLHSIIAPVDEHVVVITKIVSDIPRAPAFILNQQDNTLLSAYQWAQYKKKLWRVLNEEHSNDFDLDNSKINILSDHVKAAGFDTEVAIYDMVRVCLLTEKHEGYFKELLNNTVMEGSPTEHAIQKWKNTQDKYQGVLNG